MNRSMLVLLTGLLTLPLGCGGPEAAKTALSAPDFGPEDGPADDKADSATAPKTTVELALGQVKTAYFTSTGHFRAFSFPGQPGQRVDLFVDGLDGLDTLLYLYK